MKRVIVGMLLFLGIYNAFSQSQVPVESIDFRRLFEDKHYALTVVPKVESPFELMKIFLRLSTSVQEANGWPRCDSSLKDEGYWLRPFRDKYSCPLSKAEVGLFLMEGLLRMDERYWKKGSIKWYHREQELTHLSYELYKSAYKTDYEKWELGLSNYESEDGKHFKKIYELYQNWYLEMVNKYPDPHTAIRAGENHPLGTSANYKVER